MLLGARLGLYCGLLIGGLILRPYKQELFNLLEAVLGTYSTFLLALLMYYHVSKLNGSPQNIALGYITLFAPGVLYLLYVFLSVLQLCGCHMKVKDFVYRSFSAARQRFPFIKADRGQGYMPIGLLPPPLKGSWDVET